MNVGIVGSRRRQDQEKVELLVNELPEDTTIISGGCEGVDRWAISAARERGMKTMEFYPYHPPPDSPKWEFTKAFHLRNQRIAENSDIIYAFVAHDRKGGTENTIKHAEKLGIRVEIV